MFGFLKGLFGGNDQVQADQVAWLQAQMAAQEAMNNAANANDAPIDEAAVALAKVEAAAQEAAHDSPVDAANDIFKSMLGRIKVKRPTVFGGGERDFPVGKVHILDNEQGGSDLVSIDDERGASMNIIIDLTKRAGDFDKHALGEAVQKTVKSIPLLSHLKVEHKDPAAERPAAVWEELEAMLKRAAANGNQPLDDNECALLKHYFEDAGKPGHYIGWDHIQVATKDGIVRAQFNLDERAKDDSNTVDDNKEVVDFLTAKKDAITAKFKAKLKAMHPPVPVSAEEIDRIELDIGKKPAEGFASRDMACVEFLIRDADGKASSGKLGDVSSQVLDDLFTESLVESTDKLPPILSRIADGGMMKKILATRCKGMDGIDQFLNHDIFKDWEAKQKERADKNNPEHPVLAEPRIRESSRSDQPDSIEIRVPLPKGVTIDMVRADIIKHKNQLLARVAAPQLTHQEQLEAVANTSEQAAGSGLAA